MTYFVSLSRARENRLKVKCNAFGVDYSSVTTCSVACFGGARNSTRTPDFAPTRMEDKTEYDGEANKAALKILRELAAEYGLSHREAALLILNTWSGPPDTLPMIIAVKEQNISSH